jgi:hypothetical protein
MACRCPSAYRWHARHQAGATASLALAARAIAQRSGSLVCGLRRTVSWLRSRAQHLHLLPAGEKHRRSFRRLAWYYDKWPMLTQDRLSTELLEIVLRLSRHIPPARFFARLCIHHGYMGDSMKSFSEKVLERSWPLEAKLTFACSQPS